MGLQEKISNEKIEQVGMGMERNFQKGNRVKTEEEEFKINLGTRKCSKHIQAHILFFWILEDHSDLKGEDPE